MTKRAKARPELDAATLRWLAAELHWSDRRESSSRRDWALCIDCLSRLQPYLRGLATRSEKAQRGRR